MHVERKGDLVDLVLGGWKCCTVRLELDVEEETSEEGRTPPGGSGSPQGDPFSTPTLVPGIHVRTCARQTPREERGTRGTKGAGDNFRLRPLGG